MGSPKRRDEDEYDPLLFPGVQQEPRKRHASSVFGAILLSFVVVIAVAVATYFVLIYLFSQSKPVNQCFASFRIEANGQINCSNPVLDSKGDMTLNFSFLGTDPIIIRATSCLNQSISSPPNSSFVQLSKDIDVNPMNETSLSFVCFPESFTPGSLYEFTTWIQYNVDNATTISKVGTVYATSGT